MCVELCRGLADSECAHGPHARPHPRPVSYDAPMDEPTTAGTNRLTLMTVHAHPDDETIGTGGTMAKAVAEGHRVVLVTSTRGEMGEIVVPEMDTPENHRRLGELRAAELETAMHALGVTEWENLGYRDSDMMGRPGNADPRTFWQADLDEAIGRLVWLVRRYRPQVITTYNDFGGYGHPDHIRTHLVAVGAFERAGDATWYPKQLSADLGGDGPPIADGGLEPWTPLKLYEQAWPRSRREAMSAAAESLGLKTPWSRPTDPAEIEQYEAFMRRSTVDDSAITTTVDVMPYLDRRFAALRAHRTQIPETSPFYAMQSLPPEALRSITGTETYTLRESRVPTSMPETDVFAGLEPDE